MRSTWQHSDGGRRDVELTITNLLDNPHVRGLVLNTRDVTDRDDARGRSCCTRRSTTPSPGWPTGRCSATGWSTRSRRRVVPAAESRSCSWTSTASRRSTTPSGTAPATSCWCWSPSRLRQELAAQDTVARFGGDEFAILLDDSTRTTPMLAERIADALQQPFVFGSHRVHVSASIGIAASDETDATTAEQLLRNADLAMYQAKAAGDGRVRRLRPRRCTRAWWSACSWRPTSGRRWRTTSSSSTTSRLIDLKTGADPGRRRRWSAGMHPERGLVRPDRVHPARRVHRADPAAGLWVLREACAQTVAWQRSSPGAEGPSRSASTSPPASSPDERLFEQVRGILDETGLRPSQPDARDDRERADGQLRGDPAPTWSALQEIGVRLAIDDFGTGYSSLSYLHRFPVDVLKIDRSFIERLEPLGDVALVSTIIRLGQTMHLETVAEGIEHAEEMLMLRRQGCNLGQGFHFSPPVDAVQLGDLLNEQNQLALVLQHELPA